MPSTYDVTNWYWIVNDHSPSTTRFSSASGAYVATTDATYVAWVAAGNTPTTIDTEANLYVIINNAANAAWQGRGWSYASYSQGTDLTLTNPVASRIKVKFTAGGLTIILPKQNMPNSQPIGAPIEIEVDSTGSAVYRILAQDGSTVVQAINTTNAGDILRVIPLTNNTQNGTFVVDKIPYLNGMADGQLLVGQTGITPVPRTITKDITFSNENASINFANFTEDTNPDGAADYILTNDATTPTGQAKKVLLHRATKFKVGSFTRDVSTATGTQAVTGVGFKPKAIIFLAGIGSSNRASWGIDDGSTHLSLYDASGLGAGTYNPITVAIRLLTDGANFYDGSISTFDSDGFTISWTKTGSPTGTATVYYLALR